jgi:dTDP-4-amino-4,6-dideoxygalactose transaminase
MLLKKNYLVFGAPSIGPGEIKEVTKCLRSGWIGTGPRVKKLEENFKKFKKTKNISLVNSCSAALHLSLSLLELKKKDEVIVPALTFVSTVNSIIHAGAKPVLADVNINTHNIDAANIEKKITKNTKAVIVVHLEGRPCDMSPILKIVKKYNLFLIEDCAHALESTYNNKHCGTFGDFGCFSFYSTKNLTTAEGGMVISKTKTDIDKIKIKSLHGLSKDAWKRFGDNGYRHYDVKNIGFKYNMTDLQAAIGLEQLKSIKKNLKKRNILWKIYEKELKNFDLNTPVIEKNYSMRHARHLFTILIDKKKHGISRDSFMNYLHKKKIGTGVHYKCIADFSYFKNVFGFKSTDYPNAKFIGDRTVSLPLSPKLNSTDIYRVTKAIKKILR